MPKTVTLSLRVDPEVKEKITEIAKHEDRSPSYIVEQALKDRIAYDEAVTCAIQKGIEQADRGEFVSNEEVKAWIDSWGTDNELPKPSSKLTA